MYRKKKWQQGFTIIEILISVILITIVALGAVKIQQESRNLAIYLVDRNKKELSNTLFLTPDVIKYHKDEKDAMTLIEKQFSIQDDKSRDVLKNTKREIFITEPIKLNNDELPIELKEIMLKGQYPARFIQFKVL